MKSDQKSTTSASTHLETYLFGSVLSNITSWAFLLIGGIITLYSLLNIETIQSGGASQHILVFSGVSVFLWSVSELLPQQYQKSIGLLRITVLGSLVIVGVSITFIVIFWLGMHW